MSKNKVPQFKNRSQATLYYLNRDGVKPLENQMSLFDDLPKNHRTVKVTKRKVNKDYKKIARSKKPIPQRFFLFMYKLCYNAKTEPEIQLLTAGQRGQVSSTLKILQSSGMSLENLYEFETHWRRHWKSGTQNGMYQYPRPSNVREHWSEFFPETVKVEEEEEENKESQSIVKNMFGKKRN